MIMCHTDVFGTYTANIAQAAKQLKLNARTKRAANWAEVEHALAENKPVICIVDAGKLYEPEMDGVIHSVVVLASNQETIIIHDPAKGAMKSHPRTTFLDAWERNGREVISIWRKPKTTAMKKSAAK